MPPSIVLIDDEPITLKRLRRILEKEGYRIAAFSSPQRALKHLEHAACDLVVSDVQMPGMSGLDLMIKVRSRLPDIEFILITGYATFDGAVEATKEGAFHYLAKPFTPEQLRQRVAQALSRVDTKAAARTAIDISTQPALPVIIGKSHEIRQVDALVRQVAPSEINVLITGESGTGKELVARSVHALSQRAKGPFVAFNCGALTETLIDNELFGHEQGAYTGAEKSSPGLLEMANGGTLFLDEIGEIPHAMQIKLLRVLQEKELFRVGGRTPIPLDVRFVSATSKDLKAAVADGSIRSDFFFRINVFNIQIPALNERREDIPLLAYHILNRIQQGGVRKVSAISRRAMALLTNYAFPGNVRELENLLERAVAVAQDEIIRVSDLPPDLAELELQEYRRPEGQMMTLEELEQDYIAHVLKLTDGARTRTAEMLGIDRASLWRKIKKYGLE
jgi:DNA-binding NtrC family response regulator